jgi:hypothetical protein
VAPAPDLKQRAAHEIGLSGEQERRRPNASALVQLFLLFQGALFGCESALAGLGPHRF